MKFGEAIEQFVGDKWSHGDFRSKATEVGYRAALDRLQDEVSNRDPAYINANDVRSALTFWKGNTRRTNHSIYNSFFDWCMESGIRKDNPARQVRRSKRVPVNTYRMTRDEAIAMLRACEGIRETRAIYIGILAGLRSKELLGLRGVHFARPGWIWVSANIAKGGKQRWVPVLNELAPIVAEIRGDVAADEYILPAQRWRDPGRNRVRRDLRQKPLGKQTLYQLVKRVGRRAGISAPITPHLLRHCYGDHIARATNMRTAQFLLGHADIATTETYVGDPTLDELAAAVAGFGLGLVERPFQGVATEPVSPPAVLTEIQPVQWASHGGMPSEAVRQLLEWACPPWKAALYAERFRESPGAV